MRDRFLIERIAARAWPAAEAVERDGWLLRATPGVTRRRSWSALPLSAEPGSVGTVEAFLRERGMPPLVQVAPLGDLAALDASLAAGGWTASGATDVVVADAQDVASAAAAAVVSDGPTEAWVAAWTRIEARPDAAGHRAVFAAIPSPCGFALLTRDGRPAGVGLCVVEGAWGGIFCLATDPGVRRRGVGREVVGTLARWAIEQGAEHLYLQVEAGNAAAQALFAGAGFTRSHGYHYRAAPS